MIIPSSTYRIQLTPEFGFDDVRLRLADLRRLGVSHLYLSPFTEARPGSRHGYDGIDPTRVREELGGRSGFETLARAARDADLGIIVDIVPNHLATHHANPWWWAMLREGPHSRAAGFFDVDWASGGGRIVLAVLGHPVSQLVRRRELAMDQSGTEPAIVYGDRRFPLRPGSMHTAPHDEASWQSLLDRQHFELVPWREGAIRRNYRRFFDIDDLIGVRVDDEAVFRETHALIAELWLQGQIDGVRVDHVDGLARPREYLVRLTDLLEPRNGQQPYIVVEKILVGSEELNPRWPVAGTTGYDTLAAINRAFVTDEDFERMRAIATMAGVEHTDYESLLLAAKREVLESLFAGEWIALTQLLSKGIATDAGALKNACADLIAQLPVYRTYLCDGPEERADGARMLRAAIEHAQRRGDAQPALESVMQALLNADARTEGGRALLQRFEQLSGPVMAKGMEDTAHYRHAVLIALNEVGAEPTPLGGDPGEHLHAIASARATHWPHTMTALSTHDSKRGEDTRARILAIARAPDAWRQLLACGKSLAEQVVPAQEIAVEDLIFLLQSAVGIWTDDAEPDSEIAARLASCMTKSVREGKHRSSWLEPSERYEQAMSELAEALVTGEKGRAARLALKKLLAETRDSALAISLVQAVLQRTLPGIPDTYQGAELGNRSLVDPDNRRPADFEQLHAGLDVSRHGSVWQPNDWRLIKLSIVQRLLQLRRAEQSLFADGSYEPIAISEESRIFAFERRRADRALRVYAQLGSAAKQQLRPPPGDGWVDVLEGCDLVGPIVLTTSRPVCVLCRLI